jgi:hypothetical protein
MTEAERRTTALIEESQQLHRAVQEQTADLSRSTDRLRRRLAADFPAGRSALA